MWKLFGPILLCLPSLALGAPPPDLDEIREHVEYLSADELKGRNAGQPGAEQAARYLAERFEEYGLQPVASDATYLQEFTFPVRGGEGTAQTWNVVGLLEGRDPTVAHEVIIIGAHYDHVGQHHEPNSGRIGGPAGEDTIWNGADDNASGTSAVLEVARLLAEADQAPRRSVLFMLFGAEEHGLLGSQHYVAQPLIPLDQTVAMINMDMVGRNPDKPITVTGVDSTQDDLFGRLLDEAQRQNDQLRLDRMGITIPGGSDHTPFALARVPAIFLHTGMHPDYHTATDHADRVSYEQIGRVVGMARVLVQGLADGGERARFSFSTANPFPTLGKLALREIGAPLVLGVTRLAATEQGVRLGRVLPFTRGRAAGLERGDVVLKVDGTPLDKLGDPVAALRSAIEVADRYGVTRLEVERDGETLEITVVWRG